MSLRRELRALRYVQRGDVLRLKSYLRRHRHLRLDEPLPGGQSLLHAACALGGDACALLLLRKGADPLRADATGNNALHVAAKEAERGRRNVYTDLVVPILRRCPQAIDALNNQGTTPRDILRRAEALMELDPPLPANARGCPPNPRTQDTHAPDPRTQDTHAPDPRTQDSTDWQWKLLAESMDEYHETFGQYEDDFSEPPPEEETFESWADRISREYRSRQGPAGRHSTQAGQHSTQAREAEEQTYLERKQRMEAELRQAQSQRYQRRCQRVFGTKKEGGASGEKRDDTQDTDVLGSSGTRALGYNDIPWPLPSGTAEQMAQAIAGGAEHSDPATYRRHLRAQQITWHPDRFLQRCGARLCAGERERVLRTVTALSQELNRLAERAK